MNRSSSEISNSGVETPPTVREAMDLLNVTDNDAFEDFTIDSDDDDDDEIVLENNNNNIIGTSSEHSSTTSRELNKESVHAADDPLQNHSLFPAPTNNNSNRMFHSSTTSNPLVQPPHPVQSSSSSTSKASSFASTISNFAKTAANSIQDVMTNAASAPSSHQQQHSSIYSPPSSLPPSQVSNGAHLAAGAATTASTTTATMDHLKKTTVITSAIGDLLPGERVIMFLSHLSHVRDSSSPQSGVGTMWQNQYDKHDLVWCCAMTFYRVIVFSYLESDFEDTNNNNCKNNNPYSDINAAADLQNMTPNWMKTASVSRQFQFVHSKRLLSIRNNNNNNNNNNNKPHHFVLQMPLASIDRVEKCTDYISASPTFSNQLGFHSTASNNSIINSSSSSTSVVANLGLSIIGKDNGRFIRFYTTNYGDCIRAHEALNTYAFPGRRNLGYLFAFESRRTEVMASLQQPNPNAATTTTTTTTSSSHTNGRDGQQDSNSGAANNNHNQASATRVITARSTPRRFDPFVEYERMGILRERTVPIHEHSTNRINSGSVTLVPSPWRPLVKANSNYNLCHSYPSILIGPQSVDDNSAEGIRLLRKVAAFRSEGRLPTLTWGSRHDGASIWRSSQPKVGLQGNRSSNDEKYLRLIADCAAVAASSNKKKWQTPSSNFIQMLTGCINESDLLLDNFKNKPKIGTPCRMKIFDLRPKTSAVANRTAGYGYENTSYYSNTTVSFHGIGNIHAVRDSYQKISALCMNEKVNDVQWNQLVEDTKWLHHIRLILSCSWQTAFHVRYNRLPVLLHCSHGWDRTSQVAALAQLLLDPYYRTRAGFSCLVEKDFMSLGHPFHTRCGHGEGRGERGGGVGASGVQSSGDEGQISPIFLQFLDCVFQIVHQYPDSFEFNTKYLLLLSEHVYSCLFGTLLCDTERERELVATIRQRTHCLWEYLDSIPGLVNPNYSPNYDENDDLEECGALFMPLPSLLRNVCLWTDRHCMHSPRPTLRSLPMDYSLHCIKDGSSTDLHVNGDLILHGTNDCDEALIQSARDEADKWRRIAESKEQEINDLKAQLLSKA